MKNSIKASAFIIPNPISEFKDFFESSKEGIAIETKKFFNIIPNEDTKFVEIWVTNQDCNNFSCHDWTDAFIDWEEYKELPKEVRSDLRSFPAYFPLSIFDGINEGDTIILTPEFNGVGKIQIEIKCQQLGFRYQSYGEFQDVIKYLDWLTV